MDRKDRLKEAYKHLQSLGLIHTQKGFADALGKAEGTVSKAFNGDEKALTDNLFVQITVAFPGIFNLNYLLKGEGSMLAKQPEEEKRGKSVSDLRAENERLKAEVKIWKDGYNRLQSLCDNYAAYIELLKKDRGFGGGGIIAADEIANIMDASKK